MLTPAMSALAIGLVLWPPRTVGRRLTMILAEPEVDGGTARSLWRDRRFTTVCAVSTAVVCIMTVGVGVTVGCGLLVTAVVLHRRGRARTRTAVTACGDIASVLQGMVTELQSGAHPVTAVESVAREAPPPLAARLRALAASVRVSGSPMTGMTARVAAEPEHVERALGRVAASWSLSARHGIPLADVLAAVHRDVENAARSARQLDARLAGPRAGAAVLASLPAAGLVLGEAMGAAPVHVLTGTSVGAVLFVLGAALLTAGVVWTSALTGRVVR